MILHLDDLATLYRRFFDHALDAVNDPATARFIARERLRNYIGRDDVFDALEVRAALDAHPAGKDRA